MSDLARLDDGIRPARLERTVRLPLVARPVYLTLGLLAMLALSAEGFLVYELFQENFTASAWARFLLPNVLVLPFALRSANRWFRRRRRVLALGERSLKLEKGDRPPIVIAYEDVSGFWLRRGESPWLRVTTRSGETLEVDGWVYWGSADGVADIERTLGPRVPRDAIQSRPERPTGLIDGIVWDHYGDPPPVAIVPGKRYRYLSPSYLQDQALRSLSIVPMLMAFGVGNLITSLASALRGRSEVIPFLLFALANLIVGLVLGWRVLMLWKARNDRFEVVAGGLCVHRGSRSWIVGNPRPARGFLRNVSSYGRPFVVYGSGLSVYFFDPRFIEEDA